MSHMNFGQTDKAKIINTLFKRGSTISEQLQITAQTPLETKPEPIQRMFQICSLKVNESAADAAKLIRVHDFEMGHLPVHLISQPAVWDILLPKMNYRETLKVLLTLYSLNILNVGDPLSTRMCMSLVNNSSLKDSHIHPLEIYSILKLYEKNQRYNESVKVCGKYISCSIFVDSFVFFIIFCPTLRIIVNSAGKCFCKEIIFSARFSENVH